MSDLSKSEATSETDMARRLSSGDKSVVAELLARYGGNMEAQLRRRYGLQQADIDEILTDSLFRLWQDRSRYEPSRASLEAWWWVITRSTALDFLRAQTRQKLALNGLIEVVAQECSAAASTRSGSRSQSSELDRLQTLIGDLNEQDSQLLQGFLRDVSTADMAQELGVTTGAIRVRKKRLLDRLRVKLQEQMEQAKASKVSEH